MRLELVLPTAGSHLNLNCASDIALRSATQPARDADLPKAQMSQNGT